jgi:hypothetical protein
MPQLARFSLMMMVATLLLLLAPPAPAQFDDGTTIPNFVLDADGLAWFKVRPAGVKSFRPPDQARFIADKGSLRGGNSLHPASFGLVEEVVRDAIKSTASDATFEIRWVDSVGLAGAYQVFVTSPGRGETNVSAALIAVWRMQKGRAGAARDLQEQLKHYL